MFGLDWDWLKAGGATGPTKAGLHSKGDHVSSGYMQHSCRLSQEGVLPYISLQMLHCVNAKCSCELRKHSLCTDELQTSDVESVGPRPAGRTRRCTEVFHQNCVNAWGKR